MGDALRLRGRAQRQRGVQSDRLRAKRAVRREGRRGAAGHVALFMGRSTGDLEAGASGCRGDAVDGGVMS